MGRVQAIIAAAFAAALAPGCITLQVDWPGKKNVPPETATLPDGTPQAKADKKADGGVRQAAAFLPSGPIVPPSLPKLFGMADTAKPATTSMVLWRDRVEYLPDPTKNGAMGAGIVGQMFLYDREMKFVNADGSLTIEMYDESHRIPGVEPKFLGKWTFSKDVIRQLITVDERWGKSYALFLPWPDYKADISRVRLAGRYEQDGGHTVYIQPSTVTFNQNVPGIGDSVHTSRTVTPGTQTQTFQSSTPANFPVASTPSKPSFQMPENLPIGGSAPRSPALDTSSPSVSSMPLPAAPIAPR
jgi:hypothetical protein